MTLKQYLSGYETEDWYNVGFPPGAMMDDVSLAPFLSCGGYTDQLTVRDTLFVAQCSDDRLNANHLPRQAQDKPEEYSKHKQNQEERRVCFFASINQSALVWMSSGGTKSVVHYDDADNLNCLISGQKRMVFWSPGEYCTNLATNPVYQSVCTIRRRNAEYGRATGHCAHRGPSCAAVGNQQ
jgi:hypothetical protein